MDMRGFLCNLQLTSLAVFLHPVFCWGLLFVICTKDLLVRCDRTPVFTLFQTCHGPARDTLHSQPLKHQLETLILQHLWIFLIGNAPLVDMCPDPQKDLQNMDWEKLVVLWPQIQLQSLGQGFLCAKCALQHLGKPAHSNHTSTVST